MHPPPESHHRLWLAASVAAGWPVLRLVGEEARLVAVLDQLEALAGPLPQAVIDEPWEPDGDWALEVALPGLEPELALVLAAADPGLYFTPGPRPELAEALERGTRIDELSVHGCAVARRPIGLEGGVLPELGRSNAADAAVVALERELVERLRAVDPALQSWSSRGPDTVAPVVDPETGRFGVLISLLPETFAVLVGEELLERRRAVLDAIAGLVADRAEHPTLRLAPDLVWWSALDGMDVAVWFVAPALPVWAPEVPPGVSPAPLHRKQLAAGGDPLRLVVVPSEPARFEGLCEAGARVAEQVGAGGGAAEWVKHAGRWCFAPTWTVDEPKALEEVVAAFAELGPVLVFADSGLGEPD